MRQHFDPLLRETAELALEFFESLAERPVGPPVDLEALRAALIMPLPDQGESPQRVIAELARAAEPGIVASAGPRYFGFVHGGSVPASVAADWLVTAWDQTGSMYVGSPAAAVIEEAAAEWLCDVLGLPAGPDGMSVGFATGCTMANLTGLAAARNALLGRANWDVEADGLYGAPALNVVVGDEAHASIFAALQMLGLGRDRVTRIPADGQGRMRADALAEALAGLDGPVVVCAQAGNVNTGAFDPLEPIGAACRAREAWLHVDGAFGLWAAASPTLRHLVAGVERADSVATDGHKWLNVPYDSGFVFVADRAAHRAAMTITGSYLVSAEGVARDGFDWVPESSRRARGVPVYAALRSLGRAGVAAMIERCCALARRVAERLGARPGVEILNDVVLNQTLVRFHPSADGAGIGAAADALTRAVIERVQRDGTCWLGGTVWHDMAAMRVSLSNWATGEDDIDRTVEVILRCYDDARAA